MHEPGPAGGEIGDLAIVLHSHMPYVEGFGTWPFGEEWLFDAVARSYLPVLEVAHDLTLTVSPVLADQLEAPGVAERMEAFLRRYRLEAAERDASRAPAELRPAAEFEAERYRRVLGRLQALGGDVLAALGRAASERGLALLPSAATHAVLPLVATTPGRRLQIDAGLRSHRRRFGSAKGFWLPECAFSPTLEPLLAERDLGFFCTDQSAFEAPLDALAPLRCDAGLVAFTLDWGAVELVWSQDGYPSDPAYSEFHRQSVEGTRLWAIGGDPYDAAAASSRADRHARSSRRRSPRAWRPFANGAASPGWSPSPSTPSCSGTGGRRAPRGWRPSCGTLPTAASDSSPCRRRWSATRLRRSPRRSTWGEGKDLRTWDSPEVADLAWAARRLELRLLRALDAGTLAPSAAERAARELLAVQASDWAFLDRRRQAGDYPYQRSTAHARALLGALHAAEPPDPMLRNLAPDLSLAPLLEP